jgi:ATP-dependent Lon protease
VLPGRGSLQLTGQLGEVMRESAQAALTFVRANALAFGLDPEFYGRCELHVHVPEGAVPKDGPSAGITLAAALLSALSGVPVRADTALTGEITLRGRLLPVGGIKEKVLAARRAGLRRVVLPADNRADWDEIGGAAAEMRPIFAEAAEDALAAALAGGLPAPREDGPAATPPGFLAAVPRAEGLSGEAALRGGA